MAAVAYPTNRYERCGSAVGDEQFGPARPPAGVFRRRRMATASVLAVGTVVVFFLAQKRFIEGIAASGIKA